MASPNSRQTLIDYCLRSLGQPVIEINIDDDQVSDRVDEAIQFYREYHSDAIIRHYRKHQLTQQNITDGYIEMHLNDVYDLQYAGALINYEMTRQFLEMLDMQLNGVPPVRFNRHMNRLYIDLDWGYRAAAGEYVLVDAYSAIDPETYTDIYNDMFLKKYTTALIKRQWGINLKKFEGIQLPGGVTMNGQQIYQEAIEEIKQLEDEMELKYEKPVDFFVG